MAAQVETFAFQAETKHLLDLMIHSLYTTKAIFLRELISNAPDAFEALVNAKLSLPGKSEIRLETDPQARTLTIHDNGIGMNREEVIANIGTIAKLGTREQARSESEPEKFELVWEQLAVRSRRVSLQTGTTNRAGFPYCAFGLHLMRKSRRR